MAGYVVMYMSYKEIRSVRLSKDDGTTSPQSAARFIQIDV